MEIKANPIRNGNGQIELVIYLIFRTISAFAVCCPGKSHRPRASEMGQWRKRDGDKGSLDEIETSVK